MGEAIIVVNIDGASYLVRGGHDNEDHKAIEIAIKKHNELIKQENEYYLKNNITDENNNAVYRDGGIDSISVSDGIEL